MDSKEIEQDKADMLLDLYRLYAYHPYDAAGNPLTPFGNFCEGYEACQALNDAKIAELEAKLAELVKFQGQSVQMAETINNLQHHIVGINEKLKVASEALTAFDEEIIKHQFTGSRDAMSALQHVQNLTTKALDKMKG